MKERDFISITFRKTYKGFYIFKYGGIGMIVVTTDTIPGKKVVKVFGEVHARNNPFAFSLDGAANAKKYLEKEAEKLGANAIVGVRTERQAQRRTITYYAYGTAVLMEEEK